MNNKEHKELLDNLEIGLNPKTGLITSTESKLVSILEKLDWDEAFYLRMLLKGPDYGTIDWNEYNAITFEEHDVLEGNGFIWIIKYINNDRILINEQPEYGQPNDENELYSYTKSELTDMIKEGKLKKRIK